MISRLKFMDWPAKDVKQPVLQRLTSVQSMGTRVLCDQASFFIGYDRRLGPEQPLSPSPYGPATVLSA